MAAKPVQAPGPDRSDAADRDTQAGADLGIGHWGVGDEHADQPLVADRQVSERLAQGRMALGR